MYANFNCLVGPGGIFRAELAKKLGGWDSSYRFVPDYDFWLRLARFGEFQRIPLNLATWRTHSKSISVSSKNKYMAAERVRVIQSKVGTFPHLKNIDKIALSNAYLNAAILYYFDSETPGKKYVLKSILLHPKTIFSRNIFKILFILLSPFSKLLVLALQKFEIVKNF